MIGLGDFATTRAMAMVKKTNKAHTRKSCMNTGYCFGPPLEIIIKTRRLPSGG